jgi:tetratricopeptide (TPR) repeat protein
MARLAARPRPVAAAVAAYLDAWAVLRRGLRGTPEGYVRPLRAARAADPNPYRDRLRSLLEARDLKSRRGELATLVNDAGSAELRASDAVLLATVLAALDDVEAAVAVLRRAVIDHPSDLWVNFDLATYLEQLRPPSREEALRYYTAARALRPESAHQLGHLLDRTGRRAEAQPIFLDLIERPPDAVPYMLCYAELDRVDQSAASDMLDRALAAARAAVTQASDRPTNDFYLGCLLRARGDLPGAVAAYREAIRLDPGFAEAHFNLGEVLHSSGDRAGATARYREAIRLDPDFALTHNNLGNVLRDSGDTAGATAEYREAIRLMPDLAEVHTNLGSLLSAQGCHAEALEESRRGQQLASKRPVRPHPASVRLYPSDQVGTLAERLRAALHDDARPWHGHPDVGNPTRTWRPCGTSPH